MKNSDLHTHSYYSDGKFSPRAIVQLAYKRRVKNLALTDHNTFAGLEEAINEGKKIGINIIPAIEIATKENEVLAYFVDTKNKALNRMLNDYKKSNTLKIKDICKQLHKMHYNISYEELKRKFPYGEGNYNIIHIGEIFLEKGYISSPFDIISLVREKKIKKKHVKEPSTANAVRIVRKAGGVPVLSHPWVNKDAASLLEKRVLEKLIKEGLCGIEIDNGDKAPFKKPFFNKKIRQLGKKYNLILTSGSDFHGGILTKFTKTHYLGRHNCDEKVVEQLRCLSLNL
jgi:hypothetical protein